MRTLEEVRGNCRIDDITGCWLWAGGKYGTLARIYAPDWTSADGALRPQAGRRAVWHIRNPGKKLAPGVMVFGRCNCDLCLNPAHEFVGTRAQHGEMVKKAGRYRNQLKRIVANRKTARKLSTITPEIAAEILASDEGHTEFARRTGTSREIVRRVRSGRPMAYQSIGGSLASMFGGAL